MYWDYIFQSRRSSVGCWPEVGNQQGVMCEKLFMQAGMGVSDYTTNLMLMRMCVCNLLLQAADQSEIPGGVGTVSMAVPVD